MRQLAHIDCQKETNRPICTPPTARSLGVHFMLDGRAIASEQTIDLYLAGEWSRRAQGDLVDLMGYPTKLDSTISSPTDVRYLVSQTALTLLSRRLLLDRAAGEKVAPTRAQVIDEIRNPTNDFADEQTSGEIYRRGGGPLTPAEVAAQLVDPQRYQRALEDVQIRIVYHEIVGSGPSRQAFQAWLSTQIRRHQVQLNYGAESLDPQLLLGP